MSRTSLSLSKRLKRAIKMVIEVPVPDEIGVGRYYNDSEPCCAYGHAERHLREGKSLYRAVYAAAFKYMAFYHDWKHENIHQWSGIEVINDNLPANKRKFLYLFTLALMGYTDGQPRTVLKHVNSCLQYFKSEMPSVYMAILDSAGDEYEIGL